MSVFFFLGVSASAQLTIARDDVSLLVENDPLQSINDAPGVPAGQLAYIAAIHFDAKPGREQYLVIRHTGKPGRTQKANDVFHLIPTVGSVVFDPQFSPDKKFILFKFGWPYDENGTYFLYLLNTETQKLELLPTEQLSYRLVEWSPDSHYLAYVQGGNISGDESNPSNPMRLFIYDRKTRVSRFVAQSPTLTNLAWSVQNSLFYTVQSQNSSLPEIHNTTHVSRTETDIFEVPAVGGDTKKVMTNGISPLPSPDGKWLAFFGKPNINLEARGDETETKKEEESQQGIYLMNRTKKEIHFLLPMSSYSLDSLPSILPIRLLWTSDSKQLLIMELRHDNRVNPASVTPHVSSINTLASISSVDIATFAIRKVGIVKATDVEPISRSPTEPEFQWIGFSADGSEVIIKVQEYAARVGEWYARLNSLNAIRLRDGRVSTLAQTKDLAGSSLGLDWSSE